jgi:predicted nucleic acid-binding protein
LIPAVIVDAGPLIGLSRIRRLILLRDVFGQILITPAVAAELRITGPEPDLALFDGQKDLAEALVEGWLFLSEPGRAEAYHPLNPGVDSGEASCIALAMGRRERCLESLLILDDRAGRAEARRLDLELTGTAAVLAMARLRGLIPAAGPVLQELCNNGYFLSDATVDTVLRALNER